MDDAWCYEMYRVCALPKFPKRRDAALVMLGVCTGNGEIARGAPFSRAFVQIQYCTEYCIASIRDN